jgi:uncharacterized protein YjbI with pentapeptide repeats
MLNIYDEQTFEDISYAGQMNQRWDLQDCKFKRCDFSDSEFLNTKFVDCVFDGCNLSMMRLRDSTLNNVVFKNCKIMGVNFSQCQDFLFTVKFEGCILDYSSFMDKKMAKTSFIQTSLKEVTFTRANLGGSVFDNCNLNETIFRETDLSGVDFSTAYNYLIDPEVNKMTKAVFSMSDVAGLLYKYGIKIV